CTRGPVAMDYW
nr:immunoglobulin heavy chain junction region [Mus musculus]